MSCLCFEGGGAREKRKNGNENVFKSLARAINDRVDMRSQQILEDMMDSNTNKPAVFFVGAGASIESGLPNFRQFSEHLLVNLLSLDHGVSTNDISMFVSELRPEVLLQTIHEVFGDKIFEFYDWFDGAEPSTNHFILARVLREGGMVLTTNVDVLIESAYEELYGEKDFDLLITKQDFEEFTVHDSSDKTTKTNGTLMKFHGTVDLSKTGFAKYDSVRFLLDQVGRGISTGMHEVLADVCRNFDMVYLGYSGCDNFSVQPVLCNTDTDHLTLWMWYEWREQMVLESSRDVYEKDMHEIGTLVSEGKSFSEINRGMETLSTCEILVERSKALRFKGDISEIMNATANPDDCVVVEGISAKGPIPDWVGNISPIDRVRCAAKLYSKSGCIDEGIKFSEKALILASSRNDKFCKALILKELGIEYAKASTSKAYKQALEFCDKALAMFNEMGISIKSIETRLDKVNVLRRTRRFEEAMEILKNLDISPEKEETDESNQQDFETDTSMEKCKVRKGLMEGLILGLGRSDRESKDAALPILEGVAKLAEDGGFVGLQASILNASGLIKYQIAANSIDILQAGAKDLNAAFRLNKYIGDARSCFQQLRNLGLIHVKLSKLTNAPELLEQAIEEFGRGEKYLFRLSRQSIMGELMEIRFRLGEALVEADRLEEAEPILINVREERVKMGDWHNEARTLELLLKSTSSRSTDALLERAKQIQDIYNDALTNKSKLNRFKNVPITATNGRQILRTASDLVESVDQDLSMQIVKLSNELFGAQ